MDQSVQTILGLMVRHGLTTAGGMLVSSGIIQSDEVNTFVGAGMVFAGIISSWWQKRGQAEVVAALKKARGIAPLIAVGLILGLLASFSDAHAADMALKAPAIKDPFLGGYPTTHCGAYYGLNTMGSAGQVTGAATPGTQVVQGDIGVTIGYACPLSADGSTFVFAEGMFDFANLNGSTTGLALSGPATFEQRVALGSPISNMLSLFPSLNFPALPSLPNLPNGVTAGPQYPYLFVAVHEQDISASLGLASAREWLISPGIGIGMLSRLSNNVVADVFAEWQMQSNSLSLGPVAGAPHLGNTARVGFSLKY